MLFLTHSTLTPSPPFLVSNIFQLSGHVYKRIKDLITQPLQKMFHNFVRQFVFSIPNFRKRIVCGCFYLHFCTSLLQHICITFQLFSVLFFGQFFERGFCFEEQLLEKNVCVDESSKFDISQREGSITFFQSSWFPRASSMSFPLM